MKARDIMVTPVLSAKPATTVAELAQLLIDKHVSGVPVVDDRGELVGIVSESDLLHRAETGTERRRKWWMRMILDKDTLARDFVRTHGLRTADIMSPFVVTVSADADLGHVADVMDKCGIKRVPVMEGERLAGIITRGDLVRALVKVGATGPKPTGDDAALQKHIMQSIARQPWVSPTFVSVMVSNGDVQLSGSVDSEAQRKALGILVEEAAGRPVKNNVKAGALKLYV